jgi:flagellin
MSNFPIEGELPDQPSNIMQINTNNYALNTARRMSANTNSLQQSLQRLSSGLRINGAKDDAAGLAIADRMTTQLRGNGQAIRNIQDGTSMLQTAEGALSTVNDALQRVRELAIQAANATNSASDRRALQAEVDQLLSEVDRIGSTAAFNGQKIFSQVEASISGDTNQRAVMDGLMLGWLENSETRIRDFYGISGDGANIDIQVRDFTDGAGGTAAQVVGSFAGYSGKGSDLKLQVDMADFTPPDLPNGGTAPFYNDRVILHEMVHAVMYRSMNMGSLFNATDSLSSRWFAEGMAEFIHGADERLSTDITATNAQTATLTGTGGTATRDLSTAAARQFTLEYNGSDFNIDLTGETFSGTSGDSATQAEVVVALQNKINAITALNGKITVSAATGNNLTLTTTDTGLDISLEIKQSGANTGHTTLFGGTVAQANGTGGAQAIVNNIADGAGTKTWNLDSAHYSSGYAAVRYLHQKLKDSGADGIKEFMGYLNANQNESGLDGAMNHFLGMGESAFLVDFRTNGASFIRNHMDLTNTDTGAVGGLDADAGTSYSATSIITMNGTRVGKDALLGFKANFETIGLGVSGYNNLEFQVGYQAYQTINTQVGAINTKALGLGYVDIANAPSAALLRVDEALTYVRSMRGEIGAQLSRFDAANRSLQSANVDISAARSRTMDADYAQETAGLVRNQILQQSATAMLVQAKAVPQIALQLLRG